MISLKLKNAWCDIGLGLYDTLAQLFDKNEQYYWTKINTAMIEINTSLSISLQQLVAFLFEQVRSNAQHAREVNIFEALFENTGEGFGYCWLYFHTSYIVHKLQKSQYNKGCINNTQAMEFVKNEAVLITDLERHVDSIVTIILTTFSRDNSEQSQPHIIKRQTWANDGAAKQYDKPDERISCEFNTWSCLVRPAYDYWSYEWHIKKVSCLSRSKLCNNCTSWTILITCKNVYWYESALHEGHDALDNVYKETLKSLQAINERSGEDNKVQNVSTWNSSMTYSPS